MSVAVPAAVALGGNLGDVAATFAIALEHLAALDATQLVRVSHPYRTPAWGGVQQPDYLNAVALLCTTQPPRALMQALLAIERTLGRHREQEQRWGPRRIDLDLLLHGREQLDTPTLQLPHPRLAERAFALVPLLDVWPEAWIPGVGEAGGALQRLERADPASVASVIAGRLG